MVACSTSPPWLAESPRSTFCPPLPLIWPIKSEWY
jgi:hypothetical protein